MILCCNSSLLMIAVLDSSESVWFSCLTTILCLLIISILAISLIKLHLNLLACLFVLFLSFLICIFFFTDGKCLSYDYQGKNSLLCKTKHVMALHAIQNVLSLHYLHFSTWLMIFTSLAYHLQFQPQPFDLWYFIFSLLECI